MTTRPRLGGQRKTWTAPRVGGLVTSMLLHGLALVLIAAWIPKRQGEEHHIELAVLPSDDPEPSPPPPQGQAMVVAGPTTPTPPAVQAPVSRPQPSPEAPPEAPVGELPAPSPDPQPVEPPAASPPSFQSWQTSRFSRSAMRGALLGSGAAEGTAAGTGRGRDQCLPSPGRRFEVLYLLFDASGSMSSLGQSQALSCAHQYAKAAIAGGAAVVVGTFAADATFTGPTRDLMDVEVAMRGGGDRRATILPSRDLQPFLDGAPDGPAELVIVSDGGFETGGEVLAWYAYFLDLNPDNHGRMYTVGMPIPGDSASGLRGIGFDVYRYQQLPGAGF